MQTARDKIRELRALHEDGLLSLQEFDRRKNAILDAEYAPPGGAAAAVAIVRHGTELGLMAGQEIGPHNRRYRLERLLGMGGMGQVWQATDLATHAELGHSALVALKILPPQLTQSPAHAKLLIEEATQARRLAHDNIVRVYEWAQDPATASYFIIMECLEGQDLDAWLAEHGKATPAQVQQMLRPVADALQYAWDKHRVVHRDLKPGNVFLTKSGEIKLLDFGIASRARSTGTDLGMAAPNAGTAGYRAPEAGTSRNAPRPQVDVYAVAVMIYQMLEGRLPFEGQPTAQLEPHQPDALNAGQWEALKRGFANRAGERHESVAALLEALQQAGEPGAGAAAQAERDKAREAERAAAEQRERDARQARAARARADAEAIAADEEQRRKVEAELAARRKAEALAAQEKARQDQLRREQEKQRKAQAEQETRERKERLRQQLIARRDADALKARQAEEERQRKIAQLKAEAAYRAEQERHRKEQAARKAAELAALLPSASSPVADAEGVLRDKFIDGSGAGPDLVLIPTGRFQMGSTAYEHKIAVKAGALESWLDRELPAHWVGIGHSFALGRYPVTVGEWRAFVQATGWQSKMDVDWQAPGFAQDERHPVVCVSWHDAQLYLQWLSEKTGRQYCLPSEAEWEYACRAGTHTAFSFGDEITPEHANYDGHFTYNDGPKGSSHGGTTRVGSYQPNPWGLFDMHGNVWEWTQDVVHDDYHGAPADGSAWERGGDQARRILRGGAWLYQPRYLRSALRNGYSALLANDVVGFRVARKLV